MSSDDEHILDTVVLLYFLLADEEELLGELIGWPFRVPFAVYDPEERAIPMDSSPQTDLLSEMRQVVRYYEGVTKSTGDTESLWRVSRVDRLPRRGAPRRGSYGTSGATPRGQTSRHRCHPVRFASAPWCRRSSLRRHSTRERLDDRDR